MGKSLARGKKPAYIRSNPLASALTGIGQGLRWGTPLKGGDIQRVSLSTCEGRVELDCSADFREWIDWRRMVVGKGEASLVSSYEEY